MQFKPCKMWEEIIATVLFGIKEAKDKDDAYLYQL